MSGEENRRDPLVGASIDGRYRVLERIGVGGMAVVYSATQLNVDRPVAIKVLGSGSAARDDIVRRFQNEARVIARLRHPNVLKLHDVGTLDDGRLYIVTELLHGAPLDRVVHDRGLTAPQVVRLMQPVAEALAEAHAAGVIHRDLKPANMFLERVGEVELIKVLDFGIAKLVGQAGLTASGAMFGTPRYMSPEQVLADELDGRSDIYSLGVVLFECLSGRPPFDASMMQLFQRVNEPAPPLGTRATTLPAALEALVDQMLARAPADRPPTMIGVRDRLRAIDEEWRREGGRDRSRAPRPTEPVDVRLPAGLGATSAADRGPGAQPLAEPVRDRTATGDVSSPAVTAHRPSWLPISVTAAGVLALVGIIATTEREPVPDANIPTAPSTPSIRPAPTFTLAPAATATTAPPVVTAPPSSPSPSASASTLPTTRRTPPKPVAPIPSGFEDVDYRELGTP